MTTITLRNGTRIDLDPNPRIPGYLSTDEAADVLDVTPHYVHQLWQKGYLGAAKRRHRQLWFSEEHVYWYFDRRGLNQN